MAVDITSFQSMLKTYYSDARVERMCFEKQPLWAWFNKKEDFGGRNYSMPLQYSVPVGISPTFADGQANKEGSTYDEFLVTRRRLYGFLSIDTEVMDASDMNKGAWDKARLREVASLFIALSENLGKSLVSNSGGSIGTATVNTGMVASPGPGAFTLSSADDTTNFNVGDHIQYAATDGTTGTTGDSGAILQVTNVDRDSGVVSYLIVSGTVSVGAGTNNLDPATNTGSTTHFFVRGSFGVDLDGIDSWLPGTAPTGGDSHFSVDRSDDPTRKAGIRFDGTSYGLMEALERGLSRGRREQANPDTIWVNHQRFTDISLELGAKVVREKVKFGPVGFDAIQIHSGGQPCKIMADHNIPYDVAYGLTKGSWCFRSLKKAPRFLWNFNNNMIPEGNRDGVEIRAGLYGNVFCNAPGKNIRFALPS